MSWTLRPNSPFYVEVIDLASGGVVEELGLTEAAQWLERRGMGTAEDLTKHFQSKQEVRTVGFLYRPRNCRE